MTARLIQNLPNPRFVVNGDSLGRFLQPFIRYAVHISRRNRYLGQELLNSA